MKVFTYLGFLLSIVGFIIEIIAINQNNEKLLLGGLFILVLSSLFKLPNIIKDIYEDQ